MHRELGQADVHRADRHERIGDRAERRAAGKIGAVGHDLRGNARVFAHGAENSAGAAIGRVALIGVELDDDALVHIRAVVGVGVFTVVGVLGVRVVRRDEEAAREHHLELLLVLSEAQGDAAQRVAQERRARTLLGGRADLLIVENAADGDISALLRRKKALEAAAGALEIVELGRKDVLLVLAKQRPLAAAVEEQVAAEDVVFCNVRGFGDDGQDAAAVFTAEQRQRVDIREVLHAVVRCAVHVDGDIGNDEQVAVDAHEFFDDLAVCAHEDAARDGEWAVEPCGHQHAAVFFGRELDIMRAAAVGMLF